MMPSNSELLLWEDLGLVQYKTHRATEVLQTILQNVENGQIDQPSRQDSQHLNRLIVLADLLYGELRNWADSLEPLKDLAAQRRNGNGNR